MSSNSPSTLPQPSNEHEKLVAVEQPDKTGDSLPPPSQRRRFIGGLAASTVAIIGGCSREPWAGQTFGQWLEQIGDSGRELLSNAKIEYDLWRAENSDPRSKQTLQSGEYSKPDSKPIRKPVILTDEKDYAGYLSKLNLNHIKPHEVLRPHRNVRGGVANELPPKYLWNRMAPTLRVADAIRARLVSRLNYINSAYRSPAYNAKCPGAASRSYHMQNCALDLMFDAGSEAAFAMAKKLRSEGMFKGGIGLYDSFIHIDTRGYWSTWGEA